MPSKLLHTGIHRTSTFASVISLTVLVRQSSPLMPPAHHLIHQISARKQPTNGIAVPPPRVIQGRWFTKKKKGKRCLILSTRVLSHEHVRRSTPSEMELVFAAMRLHWVTRYRSYILYSSTVRIGIIEPRAKTSEIPSLR